jgi:ABC-type multidrug transport system permease subunit
MTLTLVPLEKLVISTKPMFYYIHYTLLKILFYSNSSFIYGLLAGHISSVLTLMLTVSFVDGSS